MVLFEDLSGTLLFLIPLFPILSLYVYSSLWLISVPFFTYFPFFCLPLFCKHFPISLGTQFSVKLPQNQQHSRSVIPLLLKSSVTITYFIPAEGFSLLQSSSANSKKKQKRSCFSQIPFTFPRSKLLVGCESFTTDFSALPCRGTLPAISPGDQTPSLYLASFQTSNFGLSHVAMLF